MLSQIIIHQTWSSSRVMNDSYQSQYHPFPRGATRSTQWANKTYVPDNTYNEANDRKSRLDLDSDLSQQIKQRYLFMCTNSNVDNHPCEEVVASTILSDLLS